VSIGRKKGFFFAKKKEGSLQCGADPGILGS
jgi:hypothetical protein